MKGMRTLAGSLIVLMLLSNFTVLALEKNSNYQYDDEGNSRSAPESYTDKSVWRAQDLGLVALNNPTDLDIDDDGNLYIADSGNSRILVLSEDWSLQKQIVSVFIDGEEENLSEPQGVFMGSDGLLYICDTGNARVVAIDNNHVVQRLILGNDLASVKDSYEFKPERVSVDSLGNVYVVSSAVYQGIMRFSTDNVFAGFFAPNSVEKSLSTVLMSLWKKFFTDAQKDAMEKNLPDPYNNIFIDSDDFIYATAQAGEGNDLKKLNLEETNILGSAHQTSAGGRFGDLEAVIDDDTVTKTALVDVHVDEDGFVTVIDSSTNRVYQYTQECDLVAIFGGSGEDKDQFLQIAAIEKRGSDYLILDGSRGSISVFAPTKVTENIRYALSLYNQGSYSEAEAYWTKVLQENNNMILAYRGIGRAALQQGDYMRAMEFFDRGDDDYFYSMAFKEYRKAFVRQNMLALLVGVVLAIFVLIFCLRLIRGYLQTGRWKLVKR